MGGDLIQTPQTLWKKGLHESVQKGTIIHLVGNELQVAGGDRWTTLRKPFAAAGYQVPTGKTLYLTKLHFWTSTANVYWRLLYGDTDVGQNSAAAPVNPVYANPFATSAWMPYIATTAWTNYEYDTYIPIPEGKYPAVVSQVAATGLIYSIIGHEE